jgi:hypothetical protein
MYKQFPAFVRVSTGVGEEDNHHSDVSNDIGTISNEIIS